MFRSMEDRWNGKLEENVYVTKNLHNMTWNDFVDFV